MGSANQLKKRYSLLLVSHTGRPVRQMTVSRMALTGAALLVVVFGLGTGLALWHLNSLGLQAGRTASLEAAIETQAEEIEGYQAQISAFAGRIDKLTARLGELDGLGQKVRTMANLENSDTQDGVFAVGGLEPLESLPTADLAHDRQRLIRAMHLRTRILDENLEQQRLDFEELLGSLGAQRDLLAATPSIRPIDGGWISSSYGYRISPFTGRRVVHRGLDIATHAGQPIFATADGRVTFAGTNGNMGKTIVISHGHGIMTRYGHCQELLKKKGVRVKRGEIIARVGNTGRSTGPHVHYEVRLNGVAVNPQKYIIN